MQSTTLEHLDGIPTLEHLDGIPTLERGNEMRRRSPGAAAGLL
jgi:hypothetical protein